MLIILLLGFLSCLASAQGEWWSTPRMEGPDHISYVGVSEGKLEIARLQDIAFSRAMSELIREHFGMSIQVNEYGVEELNQESYQVVTRQSSAPIFIKGVSIHRSREVELKQGSRVYVQIRARKSAIKEAVKLRSEQADEKVINTFGAPDATKVEVKVTTRPQEAMVTFKGLDRSYSLQGQGDAVFYLPRGRYQMLVTKPGHETVTKELQLMASGRVENIALKELFATLKLETTPGNAQLELNGMVTKRRELRLPVGKVHKLKFTHPDYFTREVEWAPTEAEIYRKSIELDPRESYLRYEMVPENASITIDGRRVAPIDGKVAVRAGKRHIEITHPGYFSFKETMVIEANRDYPPKRVRLEYDHASVSPSDKDAVFRVEYNPLLKLDRVIYGMSLPLALHREFQYFSVGAGINMTSYYTGEGNERQRSISETYLTFRVISPRWGNFKLLGSYTVGDFSQATEQLPWEEDLVERHAFSGFGLGLRYYLNPRWSLQGELFHLETRRERAVIGVGYEF
jgi:hypothetical protein